jgi:hypothetical protein
MKQTILLGFILCFGIVLEVNAVSIEIKQKYPYPLLTEDYGLLNENDLAAYTWGLKPRPFTKQESSGAYTYWQCFPRESIEVTLTDTLRQWANPKVLAPSVGVRIHMERRIIASVALQPTVIILPLNLPEKRRLAN